MALAAVLTVAAGVVMCNGLLLDTVSSGNKARYELYTRNNSDTFKGTGTGQKLGYDFALVKKSNFNPAKPTKFFIHGWLGSSSNWYVRDMRLAILNKEDVNFVEVDWMRGSVNVNYFSAMRIAQEVGKEVADYIKWLNENFGVQFKDVHIIGHSLGGQAAGAAGKYIQNPKLGRISGLDPAEPGFNALSPADSLDPTDADFVDVIHTTLVSVTPMGHVDFYPNGGSLGVPVVTWIHSHLTAVYIYTDSIGAKCPFVSYPCGDYKTFSAGSCSMACSLTSSCNRMGYYARPDGALGSLYLKIKENDPYC